MNRESVGFVAIMTTIKLPCSHSTFQRLPPRWVSYSAAPPAQQQRVRIYGICMIMSIIKLDNMRIRQCPERPNSAAVPLPMPFRRTKFRCRADPRNRVQGIDFDDIVDAASEYFRNANE